MILFIGTFYVNHFKNAIAMRQKHGEAFVLFDGTFPQSATVQRAAMVAAWDADPSKPNPYIEPVLGEVSIELSLSTY